MLSETFLQLPKRDIKPRKQGMTALIDNGRSTQFFKDVLESSSSIIDCVKLGWGTSIVTKDLDKKIGILKELKIDFFFGGTLFEKSYSQNRLNEYISFCRKHEVTNIEVSDGTVDLPIDEREKVVKMLSKEFSVYTEVGFKDQQRSLELTPKKWIELINRDLDSGAIKVITEARESGTSGTCRPNGEVRFGLIEEILDSGINSNDLIFEAPNKTLQSYFIKRIGSNVNLGNISFDDPISLETLRLGLRSDTFMHFNNE